jgi:type IV pilus assembly protein PilY1
MALAALAAAGIATAADIDIYSGSNAIGAPNVVFFLDNTANWSNQSQAWTPGASWNKCKSLDSVAVTQCKAAIEEVFYADRPASAKRPWESSFSEWSSNESPTQGQVELRALRLVLKALVCDAGESALGVNVGLSLFSPEKGSVLNNGDPVAVIYHAVQPLKGTSSSGSCKAILDKLSAIDANITSPSTKAPQDAHYGAALYEAFKYFGGYTNPSLATGLPGSGGLPVGGSGYGPLRFSKPSSLDDPNAFESGSSQKYKSPLSGDSMCGNNYLVLIGNTYPKEESSSAAPVRFQGINYTPPTLSPITSDTSRFADEWSYFLSNTDVSDIGGIQRVRTYAVNVYNTSPDFAQTKLLKSIAAVGGVGSSGYVEVGGDLFALITAFRNILTEVAAVNSVFTAPTLPVSTTTQGAYLNQLFIGMFRPQANGSPRWVGNLKQYELGLFNGTLDLLDAKGKPAILSGSSFFSPLAQSFWTKDSVFFANLPSGTPPSASDSPDGAIVEKGGVAQILRETNLQSAAGRRVYTLAADGTVAPFTSATGSVMTNFTADEIAWVRGEANVSTGAGAEEFVGSYKNGSTTVNLGTTGARHSIHGDVLHSRPVALNYGGNDIVVYYGSNDGFFRAVDGSKSGSTGGQELWSFVAPEHYGLLKRLRAGTPTLHLPETDSNGAATTPGAGQAAKTYGMDGPIGSFIRYNSGATALTEGIIFATMRRGGKAVYAFDVTDKTSPKVLWKIAGGTGDYAKLAQTWSMAKPLVYKTTSGAPPLLVLMGGGYDPDEDQNKDKVLADRVGNVVYVINGRTGDRLAALQTEYSVPSDVTLADVDGDGTADRAYVADVRGNLYRIDLPATGDPLLAATWSTTQAVKIASMGGKVFFAPDVVVTKSFVAVLFGTGDREKPLLTSTSDNFFIVKDKMGTPGPILTRSDLTKVAQVNNTTMEPEVPAGTIEPVSNPNGCYLGLATNGEKVVNAPVTIAGVTYFSTNRPTPNNAQSCSAGLGQAFAYKFPLFCVAPNPAIRLEGGGMPPSPVGGVVVLTIDGKEQKMPFMIGSGEGGSPFRPSVPKPPIAPVRTRLNWHIDNSNR